MKRLKRLAWSGVAVAAIALCSGAVCAQGAPGAGNATARAQRPRGARTVSLVRIPVATLAAALHLTDDQQSKITAIRDKVQADTAALRPAPGSPPDPASRTKRTELTQQATKDIEAVLNAGQRTRLKSFLVEARTYNAVGIPLEVLPDLKLTAEQKAQLATIGKDVEVKTAALSPQDRRTQGRAIRQEAGQKVDAVLTDDQKAVIAKYRQEHPRGRGGRGGRGAGAAAGTT